MLLQNMSAASINKVVAQIILDIYSSTVYSVDIQLNCILAQAITSHLQGDSGG